MSLYFLQAKMPVQGIEISQGGTNVGVLKFVKKDDCSVAIDDDSSLTGKIIRAERVLMELPEVWNKER